MHAKANIGVHVCQDQRLIRVQSVTMGMSYTTGMHTVVCFKSKFIGGSPSTQYNMFILFPLTLIS